MNLNFLTAQLWLTKDKPFVFVQININGGSVIAQTHFVYILNFATFVLGSVVRQQL